MSQPNGKVVSLGDHPRAKARLTPQESASLLTGCRQLALDRMSRGLAGMLDRVEEELFTLAGKAEGDARAVYLDARSQAREKRADIESAFRRHFVECFDRKVRGESAVPARGIAAGELTLVEHSDLEASIAVQEMSRRLKAACEGELFALGQRMGFLLERPELDDEANPVSPATIFAALKDACDQLQSDFKVRMTLLRQLEHHAEAEVRRVYHDLNAHLVERRILPEVRPLAPRAPSHGPRKPPRPEAAPAAPAGADLFGTLSQLLSAGAPAAPAPAPQWPPAATPAQAEATAPLVAELTRLHRAPAPDAGDGLVNVLRDIKSGPHGATLGTVDAMTIDIVAMLFDYVFEDRHIPAAVKALLGRLQIPTLKVALMDKGFFSSKAHPARRLIDLLAQASIGLDEGNARGGATLALVGEVVEHVLGEFDTDLVVFERMAARVQAFIEEQDRAEQDIVQRSAEVIEARERREIALAVARDEVERCLQANPRVPPVVRDMLSDPWTRALASAHLLEGEGSAAWKLLCRTMDDLVWSVAPKSGAEDRKRLLAMLPGLLRDLQEGMARGEMEPQARDAFLGHLVDCHALAVKAGLRGMLMVPEFAPAPEPAAAGVRLEREVVPAGDLRVEEIRLRTPRGAPVRNVFTRTGIWTNLQRGTWVEFAREAGAAMRARLTWISPNKGVYLFTNPVSGAVALSITPEALAEQLRLGEARMLNDAPLVDRAVDSMLVSLSGDGRGAVSAA